METVITVLILLLIIGSAAFYIYKSKKSGKKCIGCPNSGICSQANAKNKHKEGSCCCGCGSNKKTK